VTDPYTLGWLLWIAAFLGLEGKALVNKRPGDTLSEHVWRWSSVKAKGGAWRLRRFGLLAFLAWLAAHFLTGGAF
jgi:hypothetical protein